MGSGVTSGELLFGWPLDCAYALQVSFCVRAESAASESVHEVREGRNSLDYITKAETRDSTSRPGSARDLGCWRVGVGVGLRHGV